MILYKARKIDLLIVTVIHALLLVFLLSQIFMMNIYIYRIGFILVFVFDMIWYLYLLVPKLLFSIRLYDSKIEVLVKNKVILSGRYSSVNLFEKKRIFFSNRGLTYFLRFENGDFNLMFLGPLLLDSFIADFNLYKRSK